MLGLKVDEYKRWAGPLTEGFRAVARFLHSQHLYDARFLPYGGQLIPLAAILTVLGRDWEPLHAREKLARWYWCGVLGELYGGSTETRFARDLPEVLSWIRDNGPEPRTNYDAQFAPARLLTLRHAKTALPTRGSMPCFCAREPVTGRQVSRPRSRATSTRASISIMCFRKTGARSRSQPLSPLGAIRLSTRHRSQQARTAASARMLPAST